MTMTGKPGREDLNLLEQIESAAARHSDVGHQHIRRVGAQRRERIVRAVEALREHAAALQRLLEHPTDGRIVVDQPNSKRLCIHTESMGRKITKMVLSRRAVEFDQPAMAADEILRDSQAEACPVGAAGNERIENGVADFRKHAGAVVLELNRGHQPMAPRADADAVRAARVRSTRRGACTAPLDNACMALRPRFNMAWMM